MLLREIPVTCPVFAFVSWPIADTLFYFRACVPKVWVLRAGAGSVFRLRASVPCGRIRHVL